MENRGGPPNHLGELLRLRQDEDSGSDHRRNFISGQTLGSVINADKSNYPTLLDVLRQDSGENSKKIWKCFKDKLRLRRAAAAWCSTSRMMISDVVMNSTILNNRMIMGRQEMPENLSRIGRNSESRSPENDVTPEVTTAVVVEGGEEGPARLSLMALLEESEVEMGFETGFIVDNEAVEDCGDVENDGGAGEMNGGCCCVCMVRDKGSAFIPCGHTFCRLCSRELWVKRGNCPLCNTRILEILDIF